MNTYKIQLLSYVPPSGFCTWNFIALPIFANKAANEKIRLYLDIVEIFLQMVVN